jgi:decaprenyl-phosphate phosphoribosyltransferase
LTPISSFEAASSNADIRSASARPHVHALTGRATRRPSAAVLLRACRPRQWTKNLLVLAAPAAAGVLDRGVVLAELAGAFVALCAISSATYLVNDVRDREADRRHPQKRERPVAAGELSVRAALVSALVLAVFGLSLAAAVEWKLAAVGVGYLAMTATYSLWWRNVVVLDILVIAAGFVLRALAGGAATDVYLSRYFVIVTACCAIFLVAAKRYAEQRERAIRADVRATLARYSPTQLRSTLALAATAASVTYASWALTRPSDVALFVCSTVPFVLWLARYARLVAGGIGEAPEELILRDRVLLSLTAAWALLFVAGVYVGR